MKERGDADTELELLKKTSLETMWLSELNKLQTEYVVYQKKRVSIQNSEVTTPKNKVVKKKIVKKTK
jgi:hypothetical protein